MRRRDLARVFAEHTARVIWAVLSFATVGTLTGVYYLQVALGWPHPWGIVTGLSGGLAIVAAIITYEARQIGRERRGEADVRPPRIG